MTINLPRQPRRLCYLYCSQDAPAFYWSSQWVWRRWCLVLGARVGLELVGLVLTWLQV